MERLFKNARELAEYFIKQEVASQYLPNFLIGYYPCREGRNPISYLFQDMYDKYIRRKSISGYQNPEFQQAREEAITFFEQKILQEGYTNSILYIIEYDDRGYCWGATLKSVPQQIQFDI